MNSYSLGPFQLNAFTFWLMAGAALSIGLVLWLGHWRRVPLLRRMDVIVGMTLMGVLGARLGHIALNWAYFSANIAEIIALSKGGYDWHGALIGALLGAVSVAVLRHIRLGKFFDDVALAVPILTVFIWLACLTSRSAYGLEVRTLADYPAWLVTESPDVFGTVAPRLALYAVGIPAALLVFLVMLGLRRKGWLREKQLWPTVFLIALTTAGLDSLRGDYAPLWFGIRADQALSLAIAFGAALMLVVLLVWPKRATP